MKLAGNKRALEEECEAEDSPDALEEEREEGKLSDNEEDDNGDAGGDLALPRDNEKRNNHGNELLEDTPPQVQEVPIATDVKTIEQVPDINEAHTQQTLSKRNDVASQEVTLSSQGHHQQGNNRLHQAAPNLERNHDQTWTRGVKSQSEREDQRGGLCRRIVATMSREVSSGG